jgi:hypothetical protein
LLSTLQLPEYVIQKEDLTCNNPLFIESSPFKVKHLMGGEKMFLILLSYSCDLNKILGFGKSKYLPCDKTDKEVSEYLS